MNWKLAALTATAAASLAYLYMQFIWVVVVYFLPSVTVVGEVIIVTMMARVGAVVLWPRLLRASPVLTADLLSLEALALPFLAVLGYLTGDAAVWSLLTQVFVSWIAAVLVVAPSVMIIRYARSMYSGAKLSSFLPASAFLFGLMVSLLGVQRSAASGGGLKDLLGSFFGGAALLGSSGASFSSPGVVAATVAVFFAVALYSIGVGDATVPVRSSSLLLALVGILAAIAWGVGVSFFAASAILVFTVPTGAIGAALWWLTREKKA